MKDRAFRDAIDLIRQCDRIVIVLYNGTLEGFDCGVHHDPEGLAIPEREPMTSI